MQLEKKYYPASPRLLVILDKADDTYLHEPEQMNQGNGRGCQSLALKAALAVCLSIYSAASNKAERSLQTNSSKCQRGLGLELQSISN